MKLNILLAKTDALATGFKNAIQDYAKFFSRSQGAFLGEKKTYEPKEGTIDEPNRRGNTIVQTTVDEKIDYLISGSEDYINSLFSQERTNASGVAIAELKVDGKSWGEFTSLELLRLKSLLEGSGIKAMIANIPVRSDSENWDVTNEEQYEGRVIYESPLISGTNITTTKEDYILKDPNVSKDSPSYVATVAQKTTTVPLGDYSIQKFSGQWSQRQRAAALKRTAVLYVAVIEALKKCNEAEAIESELTSELIFGYIFDK